MQPKCSQNPSKSAQEREKQPKRPPKGRPRPPKTSPRGPQDPPKTAPRGDLCCGPRTHGTHFEPQRAILAPKSAPEPSKSPPRVSFHSFLLNFGSQKHPSGLVFPHLLSFPQRSRPPQHSAKKTRQNDTTKHSTAPQHTPQHPQQHSTPPNTKQQTKQQRPTPAQIFKT